VAFANSVIGAKTNREGGPSALAAALIGKTALYGYHLDENRIPTHHITADFELNGSDYGALGFKVGKIVGDGIPRFSLRSKPGRDELKSLGAAMAASGSVALFYVDEVTPLPPHTGAEEELELERKEIDEVYEAHGSHCEDADIIAIGCPHCSIEELERIANLLEGRKVERELWVCTARSTAKSCSDLVARIERSGAKVICDTCMVVSPASERHRKMMVNSGKALAYIPGLCGIEACFGTTEDCVEAAVRR
jgi:predicted aconitase